MRKYINGSTWNIKRRHLNSDRVPESRQRDRRAVYRSPVDLAPQVRAWCITAWFATASYRATLKSIVHQSKGSTAMEKALNQRIACTRHDCYLYKKKSEYSSETSSVRWSSAGSLLVQFPSQCLVEIKDSRTRSYCGVPCCHWSKQKKRFKEYFKKCGGSVTAV